MNDESTAWLAKAARAIAAARQLHESGAFEAAANRMYYAMYYAALALSADEGLRPGNHQRTWAILERQWRHRGTRYTAYLSAYDAARARRRRADYDPEPLSAGAAGERLLRAAAAMVARVTRSL